MGDVALRPEASAEPLNELQRIADIFAAPGKTFTDILRSATWWGPFLILIAVSAGFAYTVQTKVGWQTAFDNQIRLNPKAQQRVQQAEASIPPDRILEMRQRQVQSVEYASYGRPVIVLALAAIAALLVWPTINFGFGGRAKYRSVLAVFLYTSLISESLRYVLAIIALHAGVTPDGFFLPNPVGTNIGYYLTGGDSPYWVVVLSTFFDVLGIWALVLSVMGCSIVGKVQRSSAAIAVVGWWAISVVLVTGLAAL